MRPYLRGLFSFDCAEEGLVAFVPEDPTNFGIQVRAWIGSEPDGPTDSFDFVVCTPRWLADPFDGIEFGATKEGFPAHGTPAYRSLIGWDRAESMFNYGPEVPLVGSGFFFMRRWDYKQLWSTVELMCGRLEGPTWGAVASPLGRWLPWEYAYRYDRAINEGTAFP